MQSITVCFSYIPSTPVDRSPRQRLFRCTHENRHRSIEQATCVTLVHINITVNLSSKTKLNFNNHDHGRHKKKKGRKIQQTTIYGNDALAFFPDKNSLLLKKNKKTLFIIRSVNFDFEKQDFVLCSLITLYYRGPFLDIKHLILLQNLAKSPHFKYRQKLFIYSSFIVIYFANF